MQKKWNVMVVPSSPGKKVYSFKLSSKSIWTAAIMAAFLFVATSAFVLYAGSSWKRSHLNQLSELQTEIKDRDAKLSRLNRELSALEELEDKLRTIAGLKPRERAQVSGERGGQGGPDWELTSFDSVTPTVEDDLPKPAMNRSMQELLEISLELKDSFAEILDMLQRQGVKMSSIPSMCPVASQDAWVSSGYGYRDDPINGQKRFHEGCDIVAPRGTPVVSPADGVVTFAGWRDGLGRTVEIEHGYGYSTCYGHAEKLFVRKGDQVKRGDLLADVGTSGRSTGPHLHYEVRLNGKLVNPYKFLIE